jgi:integrase
MAIRRVSLYIRADGVLVPAERSGRPLPQGVGWSKGRRVAGNGYSLRIGRSWRAVGNNLEEALRAQRREQDALCAGQPLSTPTRSSLRAAFTEFVESRQRIGRALRTVRRYEPLLERFAGWAERRGINRLDAVTRPVLLDYAKARRDRGASITTVRLEIAVIESVLRRNEISVKLRDDDLPPRPRREPRAYTPQELERLLAASKGDDRLAWELLLTTGLREGELTHLTYGDLDFERLTITVRPKMVAGVAWQTKTGAIRTVPLLPHLAQQLAERRREPGDLVIPNGQGGIEGHLLRRLQVCAEQAGVQGATLHKFRRTFASRIVRNADLALTKDLLGHSTVTMTMRHYLERAQAEAAASQKAVQDSFPELVPLTSEAVN